MHILVFVYFKASHGGLHENVLASVRFLISRRQKVTVVCRPGPFSEQAQRIGANVLETDYSPLGFSETMAQIVALHHRSRIDVVHVHPFVSRQLGVLASEILGIPCVLTMHGQYLDTLPDDVNKFDAILAVSDGVRQYLINEAQVPAECTFVIPNTPDTSLFKPAPKPRKAASQVTVTLVTRLDKDKAFIVDIFKDFVRYAAQAYPRQIAWQVVGQGTCQDQVLEELDELRGDNTVSFRGWLEGETLRDAYINSDAVIAPGRCVLEALSCGVPTVAVGSKGYIGLVGPQTWRNGMFTNFGGIGKRSENYSVEMVQHDLDAMLSSARFRQRMGRFGRRIIQQFYSAVEANRRLWGIYRLVVEQHRLEPKRPIPASEFLELRVRPPEVTRPCPDVVVIKHKCVSPEGLKFAWYVFRNGEAIEKEMYTARPFKEIQFSEPGCYKVRCFVQDERKRRMSFIGFEEERV